MLWQRRLNGLIDDFAVEHQDVENRASDNGASSTILQDNGVDETKLRKLVVAEDMP
ncbi:hypothetical protein MMC13_003741 [Lambiella insularis]|nr:hypothetical protein [Lambiella insularis]